MRSSAAPSLLVAWISSAICSIVPVKDARLSDIGDAVISRFPRTISSKVSGLRPASFTIALMLANIGPTAGQRHTDREPAVGLSRRSLHCRRRIGSHVDRRVRLRHRPQSEMRFRDFEAGALDLNRAL